MKHLRRLAVVAALLAIPVLAARPTAPASAQVKPVLPNVTISVTKTDVSTKLGAVFQFSSTITNTGDTDTGPLILNLNFVALNPKTFVDPEDWSGERTITMGSIAAHQSALRSWTVKPVVKGEVAAYVVALPKSPERATQGPLASSPAIYIHVDERRALNPGGVLPVALIVPALVAFAFAGGLVFRRRL